MNKAFKVLIADLIGLKFDANGAPDGLAEKRQRINNPATICASASRFFSMARFQSMPKSVQENFGVGKRFFLRSVQSPNYRFDPCRS